MKVTILVDHHASAPGVGKEWGTSVHIRSGERSILLDMGTSGMFADNARVLGLSMDDVDFAVLSHSHVDHGGGLARFLADTVSTPVWARAGITSDLVMRLGPIRKSVGIDAGLLTRYPDRFRLVDGNTRIAPGVHLLTDISRAAAAPRGNGMLYRSEGGGLVPDDFRHELLLVVEEGDGLVLLTGCSHHGVLNMVETARRAFPGRPLKALVGGFHFVGIPGVGLFGDTAATVRGVAEQLRDAGIPRILTMHCTGRRGYEALRRAIGPAVEYAGAGASVDL